MCQNLWISFLNTKVIIEGTRGIEIGVIFSAMGCNPLLWKGVRYLCGKNAIHNSPLV